MYCVYDVDIKLHFQICFTIALARIEETFNLRKFPLFSPISRVQDRVFTCCFIFRIALL